MSNRRRRKIEQRERKRKKRAARAPSAMGRLGREGTHTSMGGSGRTGRKDDGPSGVLRAAPGRPMTDADMIGPSRITSRLYAMPPKEKTLSFIAALRAE